MAIKQQYFFYIAQTYACKNKLHAQVHQMFKQYDDMLLEDSSPSDLLKEIKENVKRLNNSNARCKALYVRFYLHDTSKYHGSILIEESITLNFKRVNTTRRHVNV